MADFLRRILCFVAGHGPMERQPVVGFRWSRRFCVRCRTVVLVRDAYSGAAYTSAVQVSDHFWDIYPNPSDAAWLFTLGARDGVQDS